MRTDEPGGGSTPSDGRRADDGKATGTGYAEMAAAVAEAFRPMLDSDFAKNRMRGEIAGFIGLDAGARVEHMDCHGFAIPLAIHALSAWLGLGDHRANPEVRATVLGPADSLPTDCRPVYRQSKGPAGDERSSLVRGVVLLEGFGERAAAHVFRENSGPFESFGLLVDLHPATDPAKSPLLAGLRDSFDQRRSTRGKHTVFDSNGMRPLPLVDMGWEDVILPETILDEVRRNTTLFLRARAGESRHRLPGSRSLLLSGPPGTGKTCIARALVNELQGTTVAWVTPGAFDKEDDPGFFFEWARQRSPALLYFEDVDLVAGQRGHGSSGGFLGEILAQLDGFSPNTDMVVVATTNDADALDEALRRPGRFDRRLDIGLPEAEQRARMLRLFLEDHPVMERTRAIAELAEATSGLSGAHLRELVDTAVLESIVDPTRTEPELGRSDFERALAVLRRTRKDIGFGRSEDRDRPRAATTTSTTSATTAGIQPRRGDIPF